MTTITPKCRYCDERVRRFGAICTGCLEALRETAEQLSEAVDAAAEADDEERWDALSDELEEIEEEIDRFEEMSR